MKALLIAAEILSLLWAFSARAAPPGFGPDAIGRPRTFAPAGEPQPRVLWPLATEAPAGAPCDCDSCAKRERFAIVKTGFG